MLIINVYRYGVIATLIAPIKIVSDWNNNTLAFKMGSGTNEVILYANYGISTHELSLTVHSSRINNTDNIAVYIDVSLLFI